MSGEYRVAIHKNDKVFKHSSLWDSVWIAYCKKNNIPFDVIDCYHPDTVQVLKDYNYLLWHLGSFTANSFYMGMATMNVARGLGVSVFPNYETAWHFDDKISEAMLLKSVKAPMPKSWAFFVLDECMDWLNRFDQFPLVAKLKCGSGSNNVKLLHNHEEAVQYAKQMFLKGIKPNNSVTFKAMSNLRSSKDLQMIKARIKRIPDFLGKLRAAKSLSVESGYVLFQEFIPNNGYDLKVVVVGDKLSFIVRHTRKGDFRASGGGSIEYDKAYVPQNVIDSAFKLSDSLGFQCMGYDYVIDKCDGIGKVIEISYGFSHTALMQSGGYWDRDAIWHDEPLNAPEEILKNLLKRE